MRENSAFSLCHGCLLLSLWKPSCKSVYTCSAENNDFSSLNPLIPPVLHTFHSECGPYFLESLHLSCCSWSERKVFYAPRDLAALQQHGGGNCPTAVDVGLGVVSGAGRHEISVGRAD